MPMPEPYEPLGNMPSLHDCPTHPQKTYETWSSNHNPLDFAQSNLVLRCRLRERCGSTLKRGARPANGPSLDHSKHLCARHRVPTLVSVCEATNTPPLLIFTTQLTPLKECRSPRVRKWTRSSSGKRTFDRRSIKSASRIVSSRRSFRWIGDTAALRRSAGFKRWHGTFSGPFSGLLGKTARRME
jgi:hypothetical protein